VYELKYSTYDTLPEPGQYVYKIYSEQKHNHELILLTTTYATFYALTPEKIEREYFITISPPFNRGDAFAVFITDESTGKPLYKWESTFKKEEHSTLHIDLGKFISTGSERFYVTVSNRQTRYAIERRYRLTAEGKLEQY